MNNRQITLLITALASVLWLGYTVAQSKTTKYQYDALGRLTFVEDSQNGNRDYDYDKAGNRLNVATGTANDAASDPPPPPPPPQLPALPTGLTSTYVASCVWRATWSATAGATSYKFKDTQNPEQTLSSTEVIVFCSMPQANKPVWLKACNSNGCTAQVAFPQ